MGKVREMMQTAEPVVIMTHAELDAIIQRAVKAATAAIAPPAAPDDNLWDAKRCADYLGISAYTWAHEWAHQAGAPKCITLGTGPKARRRWDADDVREYARRKRG
jgi:hypothetical protein